MGVVKELKDRVVKILAEKIETANDFYWKYEEGG